MHAKTINCPLRVTRECDTYVTVASLSNYYVLFFSFVTIFLLQVLEERRWKTETKRRRSSCQTRNSGEIIIFLHCAQVVEKVMRLHWTNYTFTIAMRMNSRKMLEHATGARVHIMRAEFGYRSYTHSLHIPIFSLGWNQVGQVFFGWVLCSLRPTPRPNNT